MILGQLVNVPRSFGNCPDDRFFRSGGISSELYRPDQCRDGDRKCPGDEERFIFHLYVNGAGRISG